MRREYRNFQFHLMDSGLPPVRCRPIQFTFQFHLMDSYINGRLMGVADGYFFQFHLMDSSKLNGILIALHHIFQFHLMDSSSISGR